MKFEIIKKEFKDKKIESIIIKMFEFFATLNSTRAASCKSKDEISELLSELVEYIETGLKDKFSENFIVLISEHPNYALKYERNYFLNLKYQNFDILVMKAPFICIPGKFYKSLKPEELTSIDNYHNEK